MPAALADLALSFPIEDVRCATCKSEGCLMYPDPGEDDGAPQQHRPSTICPKCSTPSAESYLRFAAERNGFKLKSVAVFGIVRPGPVQRMQDMLGRADHDVRDVLAECWGATEDGSDWTTDFERDGDGPLVRRTERGPSFALALLFDVERHMRGETTALVWEAAA